MAKLIDDPKVQALVAKTEAAATKAAFKVVNEAIKAAQANAKAEGNKAGVAVLKQLATDLKAA